MNKNIYIIYRWWQPLMNTKGCATMRNSVVRAGLPAFCSAPLAFFWTDSMPRLSWKGCLVAEKVSVDGSWMGEIVEVAYGSKNWHWGSRTLSWTKCTRGAAVSHGAGGHGKLGADAQDWILLHPGVFTLISFSLFFESFSIEDLTWS